MARMSKMFSGKTIKSKIMIYNICVICMIGIFFSVTSYVTANRKVQKIAQNSLEYHMESISDYYRQAYEQMMNVVVNSCERGIFDIQSLGDLSTMEEKRRGLEYGKMARNFCVITGYGEYISKLAIFDESDVHISSGNSLSSTDDGQRIRESSWFERELAKDTYQYQLDLIDSPFYKDTDRLLPIVRENRSGWEKSWAALFLSSRLYEDKLRESDNGDVMIVTTRTGDIIASLHMEGELSKEYQALLPKLMGPGAATGVKRVKVGGKNCLAASHTDAYSGITVLEIMDLAVLKNDSLMLLETVGLIFFASVLIGVMLSSVFSNAVKKPIDRLVDHVGRIAKGDFEEDESVERDDEIGIIGKAVNTMSRQIKALMEKKLEDEKEKSSLEFKMLQAQINPHFLYNTLDSIRWIAVIQKNSGIVKAVTALSKLLKNMAKGPNEKITLREELEFVNDYVTIEKLKYAEMFDLTVQVEEALYPAKIIKLTLQPLVENAIFSGIEPGGKSGTIAIRAFLRDNSLCVTVRDDGVGIPQERLPLLLDHTEKLKGDRMSSIGMPNVDRRLKLTYGEEYGLSVESELGKYTQITVTIPLEYGSVGMEQSAREGENDVPNHDCG